MVANTGEYMVPNFSGGGSAIFNPAMVRANGGLPQGAKRITAAQGYVPNFAAPAAYTAGMKIVNSGNLAGWNTHRDSLRAAGQNSWAAKLEKSRANVGSKRTTAATKAKTKDLFSLTASDLGIGAVVGMAKRNPPYNTSTGFAQILASKSKTAVPSDLKEYMTAHKHKRVQITGVPVGALSSLGKGSNADQKLENKFSGRLNKFMMPALSKYTSDIFGGLLGDDGRGFIKSLKKRTNQRVFSTSTEGGIFEAGLQLASRKASNFSGDDMARFDFEESGNISPALKDAFFPGQNVLRADAKRSDSAENIQSLIAKSFGTPTTAKAWKSTMSGSMAKWKQARAKRAAGGFVPNFSGLGAAIGREKAAGVPSSAIRINSSPRFQSGSNPAGLAVTNTMDEPRGLRDVPNFADPDIMSRTFGGGEAGRLQATLLTGSSDKLAKLNTALTGAADDWANNRLKTGEFNDKVKNITGTLGLNDKEQKKILKEAKKYGKAIRPGSGMGGMMAMMAVPMIAGGIEQAVGGRAGAAISGTATGGMMGGIMGGAALGTLTTPVIGTIIGAVVGGLAGLATSLSATAETASQVATALQAMQAETERNLKGGSGVIVATQQMKEAATLEDLNTATANAAEALRGIADVQLRDHLEGAGTDINKMREVMNAFTTEQAQQMQLMGMKRSMMGLQENEILGEEMEALRKDKKTGKGSRYQAIGKAAFGGMRDVFMTAGGTGDKPIDIDKVQGFVDRMSADTLTAVSGYWSDADIFKNLQGTFSDTDGNLLEGVTDGYLMNLAKAIESGLDPDNWPNDAEEEVFEFFQKQFVPMYAEAIKNKNKNILEMAGRTIEAGNYTKAWQELLKRVNTTVLEYTADLIKMAEETAVRKATVSARQGFLSFRGGAANAAEQRQAGATDIAARRSGLDKSLFTAQKASIMNVLKGVFKDQTSLAGAEQSILYGPKGFEGGGFKAGMESLKAQQPKTGDQVTAYINLIKTLEDAFREGNAVIDKDEKVQEVKMKALELRARIVEQEHKNALVEADNIHGIRMNLGREKGDTAMRIAEIKRGVEAPGALNFLTSAQKLRRTQGADTAVFNEERDLREKEAIASAKEKLIEIQNQANIQKMTTQLVESNFSLKGSIDILNATMSSPRPVAATGAAAGDGAPVGADGVPVGGGKGVSGIMDPAFWRQARRSRSQKAAKLKQLDDLKKGGLEGINDLWGVGGEGGVSIANEYSRSVLGPGKDMKFSELTHAQRMEGARGVVARGPDDFSRAPEGSIALAAEFIATSEAIKTLEGEIKDLTQSIKDDNGIISGNNPALTPVIMPGLPPQATSFTNSVSTEKGVGFPGVVPEAKALTSLQGLTAEQAKTISDFNEAQTQAFKEGNVEMEKRVQVQSRIIRKGYEEDDQNDDANLSLKERLQLWKRLDNIRSKSFKAGVSDSFSDIHTEQEGIFNRLGNELPMQFKNNMVGAIGAAMDKTESLGDALDGVALAFLTTMRNAFLDSAVSNMMSAGKMLWSGNQRGGFIAAQNGTFVGGNSTGDKHPALLESGEYVLNRNAVGALGGPDALNSINFGMAPRFQKGGGHLMKLAEKIPSSRFSGLFLQNSNPEYDEYADAAVEKQQAAMAKHQKKEQKKGYDPEHDNIRCNGSRNGGFKQRG